MERNSSFQHISSKFVLKSKKKKLFFSEALDTKIQSYAISQSVHYQVQIIYIWQIYKQLKTGPCDEKCQASLSIGGIHSFTYN